MSRSGEIHLSAVTGRDQYEKIQEFATKTAERPEVRQAVDKAAPIAQKATTMAAQMIPGMGGDNAMAQATGDSPSPVDGTPSASSATSSSASSDTGSNLPPRGTFSPTYGTF